MEIHVDEIMSVHPNVLLRTPLIPLWECLELFSEDQGTVFDLGLATHFCEPRLDFDFLQIFKVITSK